MVSSFFFLGAGMAFTALGSYQFLNCVCTGAMTQLWHGYSSQLEIPVAIRMPVESLERDRKTIAALRHEYAIGKEIHHSKIVEIYDFIEEEGKTLLVMEWLPFRSLPSILSEGLESFAWRVPQIALDLAEALAFFNSLGWVHRDLSPDAFMVNEETNETRLIEFPFARRSQRFWTSLLGVGETPLHGRCLAPEQIRGEALDQRADAYSLACILFELATGIPPYSGENFNQLVHQHLNLPVPSADAVNPLVTPEFARLLRQTMAKNPAERPATTQDFWHALKAIKIFSRTPLRPKPAKG